MEQPSSDLFIETDGGWDSGLNHDENLSNSGLGNDGDN
jgi:hypothetical protein